jgi:hypothetical protein
MSVGQQPPSDIYQPPSSSYTPAQHWCATYNRRGRGEGRGGGRHGGGNQQPTWFGFGEAYTQQAQRAPTSFKRYENWNYCFLHGGNVDDNHTSET